MYFLCNFHITEEQRREIMGLRVRSLSLSLFLSLSLSLSFLKGRARKYAKEFSYTLQFFQSLSL